MHILNNYTLTQNTMTTCFMNLNSEQESNVAHVSKYHSEILWHIAKSVIAGDILTPVNSKQREKSPQMCYNTTSN